MSIRELLEHAVQTGVITKAEIARARGKSQTHSSTQYPSFLDKIDDVEEALKNLGYEFTITLNR